MSFAWNAVGHMVVANIAYQHLKPDVREKVDTLVTYMQQQYPDMSAFVHISYWPDAIRYQKIETFTHWHYIDVAFSDDGTQLKNLIDSDNAVWALKNIEMVVNNEGANPYERVRFLSFLTHIVGDLHQPLHTVSRISAALPDGDRGGNDYYVFYNDTKVNLHHLWDIGVGEFDGDTSQSHINAITQSIISRYPESYFATQVNQLDPESWVKEGMNNAKQYVYDTPQNQTVTSEYIEKGKEVSEQQAALAGYRLAKILNKLLGSSLHWH